MELILYHGREPDLPALQKLVRQEVKKVLPEEEVRITVCSERQELLQSVAAAARRESDRQERHIPFRTDQGVRFLRLSQVMWLKGADHRLIIRLADGAELRSRTRRVSTREMVAPLQEAGHFFRVSRAIFVNAAHVSAVTADGVRMDDGEFLPISRKCYSEWMNETRAE